MLSEYQYTRILTALSVAEQTASPQAKAEWRAIQKQVKAEMDSQVNSSICRCEDRPACSCDGDVYQPADSPYDSNDPNNYDPEEYFGSMENEELQREACSICATYFENTDNEDDVVQGFHATCAETQE